MQNLFFILPLVLVAFAVIAIVLFINNKKKLATGYDISKPDTETILIPPSKLTILSMMMMGLGGLFLFVALSSINNSIFNFKEAITYIILGLSIIMLIVFIIGLRLFLRRNQVVQLQFEATALKYLAVDWRPRKGRTLLLLIFNQKFTFLPYADIYDVEISQSFYFGDSIVIRTIADTIYLPFLGDNKQQLTDIIEKIKGRVPKKERY